MNQEPEEGFQLFTVADRLKQEEDENYELQALNTDTFHQCYPMFDFNRVNLVEDFSVSYVLQGKSWHTKWITVSNRFPIITRFETHEYTDIGGTLNIAMKIDQGDLELAGGQIISVYGCLSLNRIPEVGEY